MRRVGLLLILLSPGLTGVALAGREAADLEATGREATWVAPAVDLERLRAEDEANLGRKDIPARVGFPMKADVTPADSGTWSNLSDGEQLWQLRIQSKTALWVVVGFSEFRLQPGAELFVSEGRGERVLGPFTSKDIRSHGQLWFPPVEGDSVLIELRWPRELAGEQPAIRLGTVSHGYREWGGFGRSKETAGGTSGACNNDVACPEGVGWEDQVRSVVRLLSGGSGFCSGALINNTSNDCTPLVLTAYHCNVNPASTTFQFDFQNSQCGGGTVETTHTRTGSVRVARYSTSDFDLLQLDVEPDPVWNAFFAGWNRGTAPGTRSTGIHHPQGDVKKITHNLDPLINGQADGWGSTHWRVTQWEDGTTEPSSSGSALYDQNKLIVGQLHGGAASCSVISWDEYGKLAVSWAGGGTPATRLSNWLDPAGTGATTLAGIDHDACAVPQPELELRDVDLDDSAGNADNIADPGETLDFHAELENTGTDVATGITGTLSTTTPLVTIVNGLATWPDLAAGQLAASSSPFTVALDTEFVCGQTAHFRVDATSAEGSWSGEFSLPTGTLIGTETTFADDVETGDDGWTVVDVEPPNNNLWFRSGARNHSPSTSWFVNDVASKSDAMLLLDPIAPMPPGATLSFWHFMNSEAGFDGGVLEYSTNGGANWNDAGSLVTQNGYNLTLSTSWESNLGGRLAWTGDLNGWQQVIVDLGSLAGFDVTLRWRFATDILFGDEGWFIDDVLQSRGLYECAPPELALPGEAAAPGLAAAFLLDRVLTDYTLEWGAPPQGGAVSDYVLYSKPFATAKRSSWICQGSLGPATNKSLTALPDNSMLLVVARNATGEGSYGTNSAGVPRIPAVEPCP